MNEYQKRTIYISSGFLVFFFTLSLLTTNWGFFLWSLLPIFINVMFVFFAKKNKYIQKFNQKHAEKSDPTYK
ncbi:hypothetical protein VBD025_14930 [Virgibacillus flavescens]|uniref:hypothetical protein n=1 Tax=Virgibacillus flavescens TaxID=1611422 RepID=UPI003D3407E1